ncbi:molybdopterin adenylyltransferase [Flammeovirga sp. OC4]|uniref:molybdopterin adenylyltransferase n=1 Tax=Flammeovirga sp. OC4 TaxID=1382345 RepID=UPI0005C61FC9|nr:molybdopterin adenylyltransferase [Flammeovirga sp. OC4]
MDTKKLKIGIINVSDRASRGEYEDLPGKEVRRLMNLWLSTPWEEVYAVVPDEQDLLEKEMKNMADDKGCSLIVTTGGTGPAVRDVTPEATEAVCEKMLPGFGELMRQMSLKYVPTAILSRQTAGTRGSALIVNLPGKPKSIKECLEVVFPAIPYCIDLIEGAYIETKEEEMKVFRPKQK